MSAVIQRLAMVGEAFDVQWLAFDAEPSPAWRWTSDADEAFVFGSPRLADDVARKLEKDARELLESEGLDRMSVTFAPVLREQGPGRTRRMRRRGLRAPVPPSVTFASLEARRLA